MIELDIGNCSFVLGNILLTFTMIHGIDSFVNWKYRNNPTNIPEILGDYPLGIRRRDVMPIIHTACLHSWFFLTCLKKN